MALKLDPGARLVVATHNEGKARELAAILDNRFDLVSAGALGLPEPEETEATFSGNALLKARTAADRSVLIALADDSGLSVAALDQPERRPVVSSVRGGKGKPARSDQCFGMPIGGSSRACGGPAVFATE